MLGPLNVYKQPLRLLERDFYRLDVIPVTQQAASNHRSDCSRQVLHGSELKSLERLGSEYRTVNRRS